MGLTAFNRMRRSRAGNATASEANLIPELPDIRERAKKLGIPNAGKKSEKRLIQEIQEVIGGGEDDGSN
ncbi:hypothetical protein [Sporosarcina psychrophila]|uniref:Rho termination factor N-terminal domain-containing protein n=1 Tax=Sporosarcina psychrophila TaxID=1476 RepID=A0ABV2K9T2_SPOPS